MFLFAYFVSCTACVACAGTIKSYSILYINSIRRHAQKALQVCKLNSAPFKTDIEVAEVTMQFRLDFA